MAFSEILLAARRGEPEAAARLYRAYAGPVFTAVRRRLSAELRRKLDSTDVVQSVFLEVLRDLPRLEDRGEAAFRHWLYIKAESKIHAKLRKYMGPGGRRTEAPLAGEIPGPAAPPDAQAASREEEQRLQRLVQGLDAGARDVVRLRLEQTLPFEEIAKRLRLPSAEAARKRYARALAHLRRRWDGR
jgi:RNA polymerase sigma factor (sigma-70 family)